MKSKVSKERQQEVAMRTLEMFLEATQKQNSQNEQQSESKEKSKGE